MPRTSDMVEATAGCRLTHDIAVPYHRLAKEPEPVKVALPPCCPPCMALANETLAPVGFSDTCDPAEPLHKVAREPPPVMTAEPTCCPASTPLAVDVVEVA